MTDPLHRTRREDFDHLQKIIASTYQIAGAYDAPEHVLDVLANPLGATDAQVNALLPFSVPKPVQPAHKDALTWCQYIAGMIETYLNSAPMKEGREAGIAAIIERRLKWLPAAPVAQSVQPIASTSKLHVGDSSFEEWYQTYPRQGISKQIARDAYAAGMGDPLATIAQPVSNIAFLYEELRKATDGGSESMTHDDALAQIKYWSDMAAIAQPVQPATATQYAARYRWLRQQDWFNSNLCVLRDPKQVLTRGIGLGADCPSRERLDQAIDAAIAAKEAGKC